MEPSPPQPRRRIQQLPPGLINRIAAGEVIERPASVVKELVENALDAGATEILVQVEDGGRELIRIIDNGSGIPPAELPLAFASHATSKLTCDEDLFRIATMGFRGEALASIGSVSHARILSRHAGEEVAYELFNRGGELTDPQAAAGNAGTTVEVRSLFFNVPARRKFLKGTATEYGHIAEMVLRLALPHPHVAFKLLHNGRATLDLPRAGGTDRLLAAWPDEFREQRLPVDLRDAEVRLHGVIGLPELARPTAKYQYLYLNGRPIRDRFIQHALREAYRGLCEPGRHPAAILLLELPPQDVDVNVHPTKAEVRFRDGGRVHGLVMAAVREKLLGSELAPQVVARSDAVDEVQRADLRTKLADFFKIAPTQGTLPIEPGASHAPSARDTNLIHGQASAPAPSPASAPAPAAAPGAPPVAPWSVPRHPLPDSLRDSVPQALAASHHAPREIATDSEHHAFGNGRDDHATAAEDHPAPAPRAHPNSSFPTSAIQLHNSYLVAQSEDGMVIIDQHALHERIMYEELSARIMRGPLESQRLLIPETLPASSRQVALLEQIQPLLARLGIEAEPFGPNTVAVHAFPSFLSKLEPGRFVTELLERGEQELLDLHEEELLHEILDMMSCKAAVKAGDPLTPAEIDALLARRELIDRSSNCPHGRPTTLRLSLRDLEKQFKRTGF